ncbi:efflux RND transporter permease subunit [Bryobacter aggregatus]|uniref:efflux RND transporter permease subunit n=1 Tax=Bryobacter aggregatus TaxID=360054 RepID=UPI0004E1A48E|nr:efflux RND transporter permease subunit [Bryobacter aggregatus]
MNFSAIFIKRPVATILLMVGIGLFGVIAYFALPVSDLPNVDFPTISVSANLPGADPTTMASSVATPLERQFTTIAGVDSMTSSNSLGSSNITMQFDLSREIDGAAVDVQTAISAAMPLLPPGMPSPPSFRKVNPSDGPVMFFALTSNAMPKWQLDEIAQTVIGQRISSIDGVAQVNVMGSQKFAVRVQVDPEKLATRGIGINEVADAIRNWNVNTPTGTLWGPNRAYAIHTNGQLHNAEAYKDLIVAWRNNAPVRLADLGIVRDGSEDERTMAWNFNADKTFVQGINLMVMRQPGSNIIQVNDAVRKVLPEIRKQLPPTVDLSIRADRSKNIREAFADIEVTLVLTLFLVILVIFLFLRKASATIIPSLALPISLVGTFAVMYILDYSLDNLSMMAIILSVGFVVDDAIVMLENIVRHVEAGESPMEAALKGSREIWFTIISMTVSLAAVFIPILFMGGVMGRLFREFAVTITVAVLISGFVSVTLTPMLASRILRPHSPERPNLLSRMVEAPLLLATRMYELSLTWVVRHHLVMVVVFIAMFAATFKLLEVVPKGFIPDVDADQISINTEMAQGTSYQAMRVIQEKVNQVVAQDPDVETFLSSVGGGGPGGGGGGNSGRLFVQLKPLKQRKDSAAQIANRLRPKLASIVGVRAVPTLPPAIRIGGRGSNSSYQVTLQATDTAQLYREGQLFEREVAKLPAVLDINSDIQMRSPRVRIEIDRDKAATYNLDVQTIEQAIYNGYGTSFASTIYAPNNQYRVMLEVTPRYQAFADMLSKLYLKSGDGRLIPIEAVTHRVEDAGPQMINHSGQLPSVTVSFNLKPGVALGQAVEEITTLAREKLPSNINISFAGTAKAFQDSLSNMTTLLVVAILVVYIVLGVLYESFIHPLTILSGLPSAAFGALLTLLITGVELNLYAFVGLILLIGLVKKNAIMQIDFALAAQRNENMPAAQAIFKGCMTRFRPIMMTTAASLLGAVPIATGYGAGGEARKPLGMVIIGGLIFSQAITLYLTPVVYVYLDHFQNFLSARKKAKPGIATPTLGEAHS